MKMRAQVIKNRLGPPMRHADFNLYFESGIDDERKCERFGMQGYEFVHDECNSKEMARKILKVYEKIIK